MKTLIAAAVTVFLFFQSSVAAWAADPFSTYDIDWVRKPDGSIVVRADIAIEAPVDRVWSFVRDPNLYSSFTESLTARVDEMRAGAPIWLNIQLFNVPFPTISLEEVGVFDEAAHAVSWKRDFGFGQVTNRWQVVVPEANGSRYYTALKFPKELGWLMDKTLAKNIQSAFVKFAADLKVASESVIEE